ncbi:MAG: hydroxypyruvate isomerase family protein [Gammaproteobacteria bacterium]
MLRFTANLSLLFCEVDLIDRFEAARDAGFEAVEIQFPYSLPPDAIRRKLLQHDLKLVLFNVDADDLLQGGDGLASVPEKRARFLQALRQTAEYARLLKPEVVNVLPGRCRDPERHGECLDTFKKNLAAALDAFSPLGVKTVFEAVNTLEMPGFLIHGERQMLDVLQQVGHPDLLIQYDVYHMRTMGENPEEFIRLHADKIGHIQFADAPGRGQPGTGSIDFDRLFRLVERAGYKGWLGAEYNPVGTTQESLDWLKKTG